LNCISFSNWEKLINKITYDGVVVVVIVVVVVVVGFVVVVVLIRKGNEI
jgi:hypothetical protein